MRNTPKGSNYSLHVVFIYCHLSDEELTFVNEPSHFWIFENIYWLRIPSVMRIWRVDSELNESAKVREIRVPKRPKGFQLSTVSNNG